MSLVHRHRYRFLGLFIFALLSGWDLTHAQTHSVAITSDDSRAKLMQTREDETALAKRAIQVLTQLRANIVVYRSVGEFESNGKLSHVSCEAFADKLDEASSEIDLILSNISDERLRTQLNNAWQSYRDGVFWWSKLDQPRVVTVTNLNARFATTTPAQGFLTSAIPYTVAVHWRLADKYLRKSEALLADKTAIVHRVTP